MAAPFNLPPDRGHVLTEQRHPRSMTLDTRDVAGVVELMIDDHAAVLQALRSSRAALVAFIEDLAQRMAEGGRLIYLGAGTSGRLGVLDASECPPTFQSDPSQVIGVIAGGDAALRKSSEGREDDPAGAHTDLDALNLTPRDTVLGIAAGGTTPYVLGGLIHAKSRGAMTALLTCAPPMLAGDGCDHLIVIKTGAEILTGSTRLKAGTATKIALNIITTAVFVQLGKTYSNLMVDVRASNTKLLDRALRIMREVCPKLTRREAAELLAKADGQLKVAIIMHHRACDPAIATAALKNCNGCLRSALDGRM